MSETGSWYCVQSDCAIVRWREYLPPKVRWRYPDENWNSLIADGYTIEQDFDPNDDDVFDWYYLEFTAEVASRYPPYITQPAIHEAGDVIPVGVNGSFPGVFLNSINPIKIQPNYNVQFDYVSNFGGCRKKTFETAIVSKHPDSSGKRCRTEESGSTASNPAIKNISAPILVKDTLRNPITCINYNNNCNFTVYFQGKVVYGKITTDCPEVELIPCKLSDVYKQIKIEKLKHLERIEVVDYFYDISCFPIISDQPPKYRCELGFSATSPECLNIYKNPVFLDEPNNSYYDAFERFLLPNFQKEICSYLGCPPPEFEVICGCEENCPENTCEVDCGDHICCYGSDGKAVISISKNN